MISLCSLVTAKEFGFWKLADCSSPHFLGYSGLHLLISSDSGIVLFNVGEIQTKDTKNIIEKSSQHLEFCPVHFFLRYWHV